MVAAVYGLVAVVDFRERCGIVGVEHCWIRMLGDPDDSVGGAVGGDAGRGSRIVEGMGGGGDRGRLQLCVFELEGEHRGIYRCVVELAVEVGRRRPDASGQNGGNLLINIVGIGVVFSHPATVDDVEVAVFAGADHEVPGLAG